ncbi:16S rRNA (guanine(966)-N(2))-methyltransferase RsmD [Sulfurospirillum arcachonense]|uniref:16S rRNA (guanine(966)-N(2))-methyltransferase RsmD n=1 Tax=Sulfurospirillum arcachonense TaxID=57666 RepID=UPI00046AB25F|nr:16S rRNA (guanine(966)-N(2))-methyltransferase RsmD [Sulfurospirillum arcachonense]
MKSKELTKKIVAGKYKNLNIKLPSSDSTRSTKSIMKESLFNTLQFDIVGENFVEVFGGSGSIGLEALSRGASHAYFFEKDKNAYKILRENCFNIAKNDTTCINGNSFEEFPKFIKTLKKPAFFYFDPPFSIREGMENIYEKTLEIISMIPKELSLLIIVEHMSSQKMPESISTYTLKKTKKFGKSSLSYYV